MNWKDLLTVIGLLLAGSMVMMGAFSVWMRIVPVKLRQRLGIGRSKSAELAAVSFAMLSLLGTVGVLLAVDW